MPQQIKTVEELLDMLEPKSVFLCVEVEPELKLSLAEQVDRVVLPVERIRAGLDTVEVKNATVWRMATKPANAEVIPIYGFVDPNKGWCDAFKSEVTLIYLLNNKYQVVRAGEVLPYTLLD